MQSSRFYAAPPSTTKSRLSSLAEDFSFGGMSSFGEAPYRERLSMLFREIEKEFDILYNENVALQEKLEAFGARSSETTPPTPVAKPLTATGSSFAETTPQTQPSIVRFNEPESESAATPSGKGLKSKLAGTGAKIKTSHKIKAQTSKIVSSFKAHSVVNSVIREYVGHKDGVWHVAKKAGQPLVGSASADHTASIWSSETGRCLLQYQGHQGSVNSIKFHPSQDLVLTASGDGTAHVWQAAVNYETKFKKLGIASDDELTEDSDEGIQDRIDSLRTPSAEFSGQQGHSSVVVMADWLPGGDQVISVGWDRIGILWNVETKEAVQQLTGHDAELTFVSAHPSQRLVVTASRDTTFRLWDFRDAIPAVSVFQGHTESVTSAVLTKDDRVVSGSDDRSVKVWELRNMRSALAHIRLDSAVNRLAVLNSAVIAIPQDNRDIRLFDLNGQRIARLARTNRQGHTRMVSCVAWSDDPASTINFYSAGFDKRIIGWNVCLPKDT